jgi:glycosyltransferase involved in cell wall biosynthesis
MIKNFEIGRPCAAWIKAATLQALSISSSTAAAGAGHPMESAHAPDPPRLKVLVCAYACSPALGSEYGVGWGWVEAISKYHDLSVITAEHNRIEIEAELEHRPELNARLRFHYVPRTRFLWAEKIWPPMYLFTYTHQWQKAAHKIAKQLQLQIGFDIVHQLTYVGFRIPGLLPQLDAPFVWGPIGGLEQTTWALLPALGWRGGLYYLARNLFNDWDRRFSRAPKLAFQGAEGGIIAATTGIQREIRRFYGRESTVISEIGLPPLTRRAPLQRRISEPLGLLWCGNFLAGKALPFLLSALALLPSDLSWKLTIIGAGPLSAKWKKLARANGVADRCLWLGQVPRRAVLEQMQQSHALAVTSVYDLTSTVVVEALANGLPVLCPDHCGFADAITAESGIKVPAHSRQELILGLRDAIVRIYDESLRLRLAEGALARSREYDWDRKARQLSDIYLAKNRNAQCRAAAAH